MNKQSKIILTQRYHPQHKIWDEVTALRSDKAGLQCAKEKDNQQRGLRTGVKVEGTERTTIIKAE